MKEQMYQCEHRRPYMVSGNRQLIWKQVDVSEVIKGDNHDIRCMHCHGAVCIYKKSAPNGHADHVQHRHRNDSEGCKAGCYFLGSHKMSLNPVE